MILFKLRLDSDMDSAFQSAESRVLTGFMSVRQLRGNAWGRRPGKKLPPSRAIYIMADIIFSHREILAAAGFRGARSSGTRTLRVKTKEEGNW